MANRNTKKVSKVKGKKKLTSVRQEKKPTTDALRKKVRGMRPKPIPNLEAKNAIRTIVETPRTNLGAAPSLRPDSYQSLPQLIPDQMSEDQRSLKECGLIAHQLLQKSEWLNLVETMKALRQGYAIAYRELQDLCSKLHEEYEARNQPMPNIEDFLVMYSSYEASKPFTEHQWMTAIMNVVMPHLADIIDKHTADDAKEEIEALADANEKRKSRPVPIGFKHHSEQELPLLERDKSLILVGWWPALKWLLGQVCDKVFKTEDDEQTYMVVRFHGRKVKADDQQARLISIGMDNWRGCGTSDKHLAMCMGEYAYDKITQPPDLLVCDHLGLAYQGNLAWRPMPASAGDAQRRFRKWCDAGGAAFIAGLPTPDKQMPDISGPEYEQLKTFCHLRSIGVEEVEGKYRITVGHAASVFDVEKDVLDNAGDAPSLLVTPGM